MRVLRAWVPGDPDDPRFPPECRGGLVVCGTMNPSTSADRQYIDFNRVFLYKAGTYATATIDRY